MAGLPATSGPNAQQTAAIQAALQQALTSGGAGGSLGGFDSSEMASLAGSGVFDPAQLNALQTNGLFDYGDASGTYQNAGGGNSGGILAAGTSYADKSLANLPNAPQSTAADTAGFMPTVQQLQAAAPLPYSDFGTTPVLGTSTYNAANPQAAGMVTGTSIDPSQSQGLLNQNMSLLQTEFAPQFAQQQEALGEQDASRGIFNSGAAQQAQNDLTGQQNSTIAAAQSPLVAQGYGYEQNDLTMNAANQQQANLANQSAQLTQNDYAAGLQQEANAGNAAATNATNQYNANAYTQQTTNDQNAYNQYQAYLLQQGIGNANTLNGAYLNTYAPANTTALQGLNNGATNATNAYTAAGVNSQSGTAGLGALFGNIAKPASTSDLPPPTYSYGGSPDTSNRGTGGDNTAVNGDNFLY